MSGDRTCRVCLRNCRKTSKVDSENGDRKRSKALGTGSLEVAHLDSWQCKNLHEWRQEDMVWLGFVKATRSQGQIVGVT